MGHGVQKSPKLLRKVPGGHCPQLPSAAICAWFSGQVKHSVAPGSEKVFPSHEKQSENTFGTFVKLPESHSKQLKLISLKNEPGAHCPQLPSGMTGASFSGHLIHAVPPNMENSPGGQGKHGPGPSSALKNPLLQEKQLRSN
eukprot:TRINITY_DN78168_c0_g1_i1.p3 TRINITY_DN78168_c0_g1~~TRINITY_DN78168_c0_g1_i1.p3  ORF type:complete len:142 (+),score=8.28 TRINITY_DN78168_c0_g1_i1:1006-1431(+)